MHNKAVAPDRRGRAVYNVYEFEKKVWAVCYFCGSPYAK